MSYLDKLFSLRGKTAVVIGGTGELCGTMAVSLAKAGAEVVLVGRERKKQLSDFHRSATQAARVISSRRILLLVKGYRNCYRRSSKNQENATYWSTVQVLTRLPRSLKFLRMSTTGYLRSTPKPCSWPARYSENISSITASQHPSSTWVQCQD